MNRTSKFAFVSVLSNSFVVVLKIVIGIVTGSAAVISEAIHTALDLLASLIAFISVRISGKPADSEHPFGHGKFENVSGTIETLLIFVAGIWVIYECILKLLTPEPIRFPTLAILVMFIGALINFFVSKVIKKEADRINSIAMKSYSLHLITDVYTSLGVAVGLLVVHLTGWYILDPIIGIVLAVYIMFEAVKLMNEAFPPLLDTRLSDEKEEQIFGLITLFQEEYIEIHDFRTRRSGNQEFVDFHMVVPSHQSIEKTHDLCNRIENKIINQFNDAEVLIHPEPESESKN